MSENDELKDFMDELEGSTEDNQVNMDVETYEELPPITEEEFEQKLMSGVAMLLDNCNTVAHALKKRIESGDSFEGTVLGFAQATDNTIKTLKVLENRRNLKLKEDKNYIRQQDGENIKLIASVNIVLNQLVKQTDKGNDDLTNIKQNIGAVKPIITDNVQRLLDIHHNVLDLKKDAN